MKGCPLFVASARNQRYQKGNGKSTALMSLGLPAALD
jgi:hypothetical protein